ncbi:MAG: GFA family protein [Sphingorhabdus sp.]
MKTFRGSCHCEAVKFTIKTDPEYSVRCDCSICRRRGAIMVRCDQNDLDIQTGQQLLTKYRFNTNVAVHYFCGRCGVYTFHKMRKLPDKFAINAGCIDGIDLSALRPILIEGSKA